MVGLLADKRVSKGKHHGDTDTDKESSVDKTGQKEHLGLQCVDKLRLASRSFEVFATHDSDTDTGTEGTKANDQANATYATFVITNSLFNMTYLNQKKEKN